MVQDAFGLRKFGVLARPVSDGADSPREEVKEEPIEQGVGTLAEMHSQSDPSGVHLPDVPRITNTRDVVITFLRPVADRADELEKLTSKFEARTPRQNACESELMVPFSREAVDAFRMTKRELVICHPFNCDRFG